MSQGNLETLVQGNANSRKKVVSLDLGNLDDFDDNIMSNSVEEEKVHIAEPIEATVSNIDLLMNNELSFNQGDVSKKFFKCTLKVTVEFMNPETKEMTTSTTNYGGMRFYPKLDEYGNPMYDERGNPIKNYYWTNSANGKMVSYFTKLLTAAQESDKSINTFGKFFAFLQTNPKCLIKSEYTSFGGNGSQTHKHVIQEFLKE